jgi:hypothetical protein
MSSDKTADVFSMMTMDASDQIWLASNSDDLGGADDFGEGCGDCADPDGAGVRYLAEERQRPGDSGHLSGSEPSVQDLLASRREVFLGK